MIGTNIQGAEHWAYYDPNAGDRDFRVLDPGKFNRCIKAITTVTAGTLVLTRPDGTSITFAATVAGTRYPIAAKSSTAAGTSVTGILVEW